MNSTTTPDHFTLADVSTRTDSGFVTSPLSVRIRAGEAVAVVGAPGCGKTLVFESLGSVQRPGIERLGQFALGRTALVPQDPRLSALPTDRVWTLLGMSRWSLYAERLPGLRTKPRTSEMRARELMARLRLDTRRIAEMPFRELSGSERRRVLLCAALLEKPEVLLVDGWGESLDRSDRLATAALLVEERKRGLRVLLSCRNYPLQDFPVDEALSLNRIAQVDQPALPLIKKTDSEPPHDFPLLELDRLVVTRGRIRWRGSGSQAFPVNGASLFVRHGETLVLLGMAGSGKSTLLEAVAGLHPARRGVIRVNGEDVTYARGRRARRVRRDVQIVFQNAASALDGERTVFAHLEEARNLAKKRTSSPQAWMEKIGLNEELLGMRADVLSASESQRVDLARSLIVSPQLILLDNPEVGAVNADGGVMTALVKAEKGLGRAFLIATNEPETAIALADRVAVLHAGRVIELGRQSDVFRKPAHPVTLAMLEGTSLPATDPTRPPVGCAFAEACAFRQPICQEKEPMLAPLPGRLHLQVAGTHRVACFHPVLD